MHSPHPLPLSPQAVAGWQLGGNANVFLIWEIKESSRGGNEKRRTERTEGGSERASDHSTIIFFSFLFVQLRARKPNVSPYTSFFRVPTCAICTSILFYTITVVQACMHQLSMHLFPPSMKLSLFSPPHEIFNLSLCVYLIHACMQPRPRPRIHPPTDQPVLDCLEQLVISIQYQYSFFPSFLLVVSHVL